ncbi:SDR family NAD(P)-dependent oxidoreductase [Cetobacterium sp.]|uniref:SDR family NAD(P)-dependent oxidoreductase n=1 Tax=Cetobacterium sp. TaxID=2071632 RepID=UPI003F32C0A0
MSDRKNILITGATDGIGLETAKKLAKLNHNLIIHGRNNEKLEATKNILVNINSEIKIKTIKADLSIIKQVRDFVKEILTSEKEIDIIINNAGIYKGNGFTPEGVEEHFAVNTIAPYYITKELISILNSEARVINLSSAAQSSIDINALVGSKIIYSDGEYYAQSKLGITMWNRYLANEFENTKLEFIAVNPKSLLGSKMVKEAYGIKGSSLEIGADILVKASLSEEFKNVSGAYFDNDIKRFSKAHPDVYNNQLVIQLIKKMEEILEKIR